MRSPRIVSAAVMALSLTFGVLVLPAADAPAEPATAEMDAAQQKLLGLLARLKPQSGTIVIGGGLATIQVPENLQYLDSDSTNIVLVDLWGNPPGADTLGMLVPKGVLPVEDAAWGAILSFEESGYVKDDDAAKINYDELLAGMKKDTLAASKERQKQGYAAIALVGWATPPRYDSAAKKLYWAKELSFEGHEQHTLNYNIRVLGRKGVLNLNVVGGMEQLAEIEAATPGLLAAIDFNPGNRYADFKPGEDHVAEYGIAALIAGGIAAKTGLLKLIWVAILGAKKFIVLGAVAVGAWISRLIKGRKDATPPPVA
jgi:uncharacterized membrane-anchored protein